MLLKEVGMMVSCSPRDGSCAEMYWFVQLFADTQLFAVYTDGVLSSYENS